MIAEVYPLRRMPRTFSHLDYSVSDELEIKRGMLVQIPFRQQQIYGIVKRLKDKPPRGITLKPITSLFSDFLLSEEEISFFESIAKQISQSICGLLHTSIPTPPKKNPPPREVVVGVPLTIPTQEGAEIARIASSLHERRKAFVCVPDLRRTAAVIARYLYQQPNQKAMIVCPTVRDVALLCRFLHYLSPVCVTGEEKNPERFACWKQYRQSKKAVLITTRTGLLYPDASTTSIFVVRSNHPNHVQHNRNPRLDARVITRLFSERFTTNLYFLDVVVTGEDVLQFGKEHIFFFPTTTPLHFVDASKERPVSSQSAITTTTWQHIAQTIQTGGRVLVVYNKKGYAIRLRCLTCDHRFVCSSCGHLVRVHALSIQCVACGLTESTPQRCPSCKSSDVQQRGYGSERLSELFQEWFPGVSLQLVDAQHPAFDPNVTLTLATQFFLENLFDPFDDRRFTCVAHLDPDSPLFATHFRATQKAVAGLCEWIGVAYTNHAQMIIQTQEVDLFRTFLEEPFAQLQEELTMRSSYGQPPFSKWIRVTIREDERKKRELEAYLLTCALEKLNGVRVSSQVSTSLSDQILTVRCPLETVASVLEVFSTLGDHYIIDVNAFS